MVPWSRLCWPAGRPAGHRFPITGSAVNLRKCGINRPGARWRGGRGTNRESRGKHVQRRPAVRQQATQANATCPPRPTGMPTTRPPQRTESHSLEGRRCGRGEVANADGLTSSWREGTEAGGLARRPEPQNRARTPSMSIEFLC